jgi:sugar phosphate isomerase/epimerase
VELGVEAVEIGAANYAEGPHLDLPALLASKPRREAWKKSIERRGLTISAISCHGNPLHPRAAVARRSHEGHRKTVLLAERLGVERVLTFSGCPGDGERAKVPNWVTCAWPNEFADLLEWQWREKVIPYWKEEAAFARKHGVKICFEPHPGFVVYNPETMLKIRDACGPTIGANLDPSHLMWQGIDVPTAIRRLGDSIYHVHAKDTKLDRANMAVNGCLDTKSYAEVLHRSWVFRTIGYGHDAAVWKDIVSSLRMVGYDYVLSIEHEDGLMSRDEGLGKAVAFLKDVIIQEKKANMWWG